jgi:hypothetical protein
MKIVTCAALVGVSALELPAHARSQAAEPMADATQAAVQVPAIQADPDLYGPVPDTLESDRADAESDRGRPQTKLKLRVETLRDLSLELHFIGQQQDPNTAFNRTLRKTARTTIPDTTDIKISPNTKSAPYPTIVYSGGTLGFTRSAPGSAASNYQPPVPPSNGPAGAPSASPASSSDTDGPPAPAKTGSGGADRDRQGPGNNGGSVSKTGSGGADRDRQGPGNNGGSVSKTGSGGADRDRQGPGNNGGSVSKTGSGGSDRDRQGPSNNGGSVDKNGGSKNSGDDRGQSTGDNGGSKSGGSGSKSGGSGSKSGGSGSKSGGSGSKSGGSGGDRTGPQ